MLFLLLAARSALRLLVAVPSAAAFKSILLPVVDKAPVFLSFARALDALVLRAKFEVLELFTPATLPVLE